MVALALACVTPNAHAELRLHGIFGDHMVLQRNAPIRVWGWAAPGERITVAMHRQKQQTLADEQGAWTLQLAPEAAGGPHQLLVSGQVGSEQRLLSDVLIGEVWLASGQSNMEMSLRQSLDGPADAAAANDPLIRHVKIAHRTALRPMADIEPAAWQSANAESAGEFSAVAYHFARRMRRELGVPVGLVNLSWGGTVIETWMSPAALQTQPEMRPLLANFAGTAAPSAAAFEASYRARMLALVRGWQGMDAVTEQGLSKEWSSPSYDDSGWASLQAPGVWEAQGLPDFDGRLWYRKTFSLSEAQASRANAALHLARVDDCDESYVNGQAVGGLCGWDTPRRYALAPGVLRAGTNVIAVRVTDNGGGGGLHGPAESLRLQVGDEVIALAGPWKARVESVMNKTEPGVNDLPSLLFNGMLNAIVGFNMRGMLWYQGESNVERAAQYQQLLPAFIKDLRGRWGQGEFPFYLVQLAADKPSQSNSLAGSRWAELRDAQARSLSAVAKTGMVVTTDICDGGDLHPRPKREVGERLAGLALSQDYGRAVPALGPTLRKMTVRGSKAELQFANAGRGLLARDGRLRGFAIADASRVFYPALADIVGDKVIVHHAQVTRPVAVRFGWVDNPEQNNLFNRDGLPAVPFRTDDWPRLTEKASYAF
jgi:sialate O-acetylesterase